MVTRVIHPTESHRLIKMRVCIYNTYSMFTYNVRCSYPILMVPRFIHPIESHMLIKMSAGVYNTYLMFTYNVRCSYPILRYKYN